MFNGSRFFNLLRKWKNEDKNDCILILHAVVDHYFGTIAGYTTGPLKIEGYFSVTDIDYVLDSVGYSNYSLDRMSEPGVTYVTLRNSL